MGPVLRLTFCLCVLAAMCKAERIHYKEFAPNAPACQPMSKELLQSWSKNNFILVTVLDKILVHRFGRSWVQNVQTAGITYYGIGAFDPYTSHALKDMGVEQCFNAPAEQLHYKGQGKHDVVKLHA